MIEHFMILIIKDLGPTGLLICGLYFMAGKHLEKMEKHIEIMNQELGEIRDIIKTALDKKGKI